MAPKATTQITVLQIHLSRNNSLAARASYSHRLGFRLSCHGRIIEMTIWLLRCMSPVLADFVAKVPKYQATFFLERNEVKLCSPFNMAPRPLAKPPVSLSLGDEVPHIFIRESHQRPRKNFDHGGKRLLQQNRHIAVKL